MTAGKLTIAVLLIAALGTGGIFAGRFLLGGGGSQALQPNVVDQLQAVQTQEAQQQAEPRFNGQLLGIYIAPSLDQLPQNIQDERRRAIAGGCQPVPLEQASALDFSRPLAMPADYVLSSQDSADVGHNPWALACSGHPSSLGWDYTTPGARGIPANVSIVRGIGKYQTADVPASRISTQVINGREAIVIKSGTADGLGQMSDILFPEPFGKTSIHAFNLSQSDLLRVAAAVAGASR